MFDRIFNYKINNSIYDFRIPGLAEKRDGKTLMVWNELAYWTVTDDELNDFLHSFDGRKVLSEIIDSNPEWKNKSNDIYECVKTFVEKGVLYSRKKPAAENRADNPKIENITVNITYKCNLSCSHCYFSENLNRNTSAEISGREIASFLKSSRKHFVKAPSLFLLGGEPLIVGDKLEAVLAEASKSGFETTLSTNGTLIGDDFIAMARKYKLKVQVSLDGPKPEINDFIRGKGTFEKILKNVELLIGNKIHTVLCMSCHDGNIGFIEEYYKLAHALKADGARIIPLKVLGNAFAGKLKPASIREIISKCSSLFIKNKSYRKLAGTDAMSILLESCYYSSKRSSCGSGTQTILLDADGSVYPCLNANFDFLRIGNIREKNFRFDLEWEKSKRLNEFRNNVSVDNDLSECRDCAVKNWCLGGCHGETYKLKNSFFSKPHNCDDLKQSVIDCLWLISDYPDLLKTEKEKS